VVVNGEGAMHGGRKHSHIFSRVGQQMKERGIPVFLINTVFAERTPEIVARMRHFTGIYCRETQSAQRLAASGVNARVCPDLTFALVVLSHFAIPAAGCESAMRLIRSAGGFDGLAAIGRQCGAFFGVFAGACKRDRACGAGRADACLLLGAAAGVREEERGADRGGDGA